MGFELDHGSRNRFFLAASIAAGTCAIIRNPIAYAIAAALGLMMADPDQMRAAEKEWKTLTHGGVTDEIGKLTTEVKTLLGDLKDKAHWDSGTYDLLKGQADEYIKQAENLANTRDGVGGALESSAKFYDMLSWVAMAVAVAMVVWSVLIGASIVVPPVHAAAQMSVNLAATSTWNMLKPILMKAGMLAFAAYSVYQLVSMQSTQMGMKFQNLKAAPATFNATGLANDSKSGAMTPTSVGESTIPGMDKLQKNLPTGSIAAT